MQNHSKLKECPSLLYNRNPDRAQRLLVVCHNLLPSGGLLRFQRLGSYLRKWGNEVSFVAFENHHSCASQYTFPILSIDEAYSLKWDAVMVPGAGFPKETIEKLSIFHNKNFGTRVQHILNDQSIREKFKLVNRIFKPHVVLFNNQEWPPGDYTDFIADRFHVLLGAIDTQAFRPLTYRCHPLNKGKWIIGGLANKNPLPIIKSLMLLPDDVSLRLFGPDIYNLEAKYSKLVELGRLTFVGLIFDENLAMFYREVDCVVMTETMSGWSNMVAEAMASGVPVVCTKHGTKAFAINNITALIVESPDEKNIANNVLKLRKDAHLCARLTEAARNKMQSFSWDNYAEKFLRFISHDGVQHYLHAPELGLYGKWPIYGRLNGLQPILRNSFNMSVLDLGAAEGVIALEFLKKGANKVHGFELDPQRVSLANAICKDYNNAVFRNSDLSNWNRFINDNADLLQGQYDIVLYLGIHHHLPKNDRKEIIAQAANLAKSYLAIRTTREAYESDKIDLLMKENNMYVLDYDDSELQDQNIGILKIYKKSNDYKSNSLCSKPHFVSFPKSGRTWIRYILHQIGIDEGINFHHDGFEYNDGAYPPLNFDVHSRLNKYRKIDKLIYLERDPRDTMVSLYYQVTGRFSDIFNYNGSISDFVRHDYFGAHNLARFRDIWSYIVAKLGFLKISYEECHNDMETVIKKILNYYNITYSIPSLSKIIINSNFKNMRDLEKSENFAYPWLRPKNNAPKVRKGKIGGYKEELTPGDIFYLDNIFEIK